MGIEIDLAIFCLAYFWASPSYAYLIALFYKVNILTKGSGNPGATNVFRECGKSAGIICFLLDFQKGFLPILCLAYLIGALGKSPFAITPYDLTCLSSWSLACVLGHVFTPWLKFKGGKGVATTAGCFCAFYPFLTFVFVFSALLFFLLAKATRYISLASVISAILMPMLIFIVGFVFFQFHKEDYVDVEGVYEEFCFVMKHLIGPIAFGAVLSGLIIFRHRGNLGRILNNQEPKIDNHL